MQRFCALYLTLLGCVLVGCSREQAKPPETKGVNITAPGMNIQVNPGGGATIEAPGVKVNADGKGVEIKAPNINSTVPK